ncbi:MAG: glycosyltransferase [Sphingobacteriaceae bacterium]|nr:MAG: glycosyltransferase [Sphingobacteriaceae bacterium]
MKLLHITASMDPKLGGVSQALKTIIKGLNAYPDIYNEVVSFDDPDASFILENPDHINALGSGKGPWFYNPDYISWLIQNLSKFDIVVLHGLWNYQGFGLIKAFKQLKLQAVNLKPDTSFSTKFYVMPHGMLDPYFQKASGRKLKAIRNWLYWKLIERKVVNQADGLLFTCKAELQLARKTFTPYLPVKELVVGLGVEEPPAFTESMREAFLSKCPGLKNQPYLLFISRIHEKKGVDLLVNAYHKTHLPENQITNFEEDASFIDPKSVSQKLVVAGPGLETLYGEKIKSLALQFQTAETTVLFPDMLTGDAKWGAFYGCEAFVLPSHQENFGIAVVEALACGKPVLISNQVNIWEEIFSSKAGIIADDTAAGTLELLETWNKLSKEEKIEMGKNARKCYEKHFAMRPAASNLLKAITAKN